MKRTQTWCDAPACGRVIQDRRVPKGDYDKQPDTSWEIWAPEPHSDLIFCSVTCLIQGALDLEARLSLLEKNEDARHSGT